MIRNTPFNKRYPKTSRDFFNDFDLLPSELKRMLEDLPYCPDMKDIKAAWELAQEMYSLDDVINHVKCLPKTTHRPESPSAKARREKEERKRKQFQNQMKNVKRTGAYELRQRSDKHERLVSKVVSEKEAAELLARRKQNNDVVSAAKNYWVWNPGVTYERQEKVNPNDALNFMEFEPRMSIMKNMHNAGGKKE